MIASAMGAAFGQNRKPKQNSGNASGGFKSGMGSMGKAHMFNKGPSRMREEPTNQGMAPSPAFQSKSFKQPMSSGVNPINQIESPINPSQNYPGLNTPPQIPSQEAGNIGPSPNMDFQSMMGQMGQPAEQPMEEVAMSHMRSMMRPVRQSRPDVMPRREMQIGPAMM